MSQIEQLLREVEQRAQPTEAEPRRRRSQINELLTEVAAQDGYTAADAARDVGVTALRAALMVPQTVIGLADIPTGGRVGRFLEDRLGIRPQEAARIAAGWASDELQLARQRVEDAEGFVETLGAAARDPAVVAAAVAESLPSVALGGLIGRGITKVAPKVNRWVAGAAGEGAVAAGATASEIRDQTEDGLLTPGQAAAAVGAGAGTALVGGLGGRLAQRAGLPDVDTWAAGGGLARGPGSAARMVGAAAATEGAEELVQSGQEQAWQNLALDRPLLHNVGDAAAMGLVTGVPMGAGVGGIAALTTPATQPGAPDLAPAEPAVEPPPQPPAAAGAPSLAAIDAELDRIAARRAELAPGGPWGPAFDGERAELDALNQQLTQLRADLSAGAAPADAGPAEIPGPEAAPAAPLAPDAGADAPAAPVVEPQQPARAADFWSWARAQYGLVPAQITVGSPVHAALKAEYDALRQPAEAAAAPGSPARSQIDELLAQVDAQQAAPPAAPDADLGAAPADRAALQPRDRSRAASVVQMAEIARAPDYLRLGPSRTPEAGAPMAFAVGDDTRQIRPEQLGREDVAVMSDGQRVPFRYAVVEAPSVQPSHFADGRANPAFDAQVPGQIKALNNARTAGVRAAFELGTAEPYVAGLKADAALHGVSAETIARMRQPMLVRLYSERDNTRDIGARSQGQTLAMSPAELARQDAPLLDSTVLETWQPGDVASAANRDFVRAFVGRLRAAGQDTAALMQADGQLSQDGRRRIQAALMQAAYADSALVEEMFDSTDTDIKAAGEALRNVAGAWANLRDSARAGAINPATDVSDNLMQALHLIQRARRERRGLADLVNQPDLLAGAPPDAVTQGMLRLFYDGQYLTRPVGRARLERSLQDYVAAAAATRAGADMFGRAPAGPIEILAAITGAQHEPAAQVGAQDRTREPDGRGDPGHDPGAQRAAGGQQQLGAGRAAVAATGLGQQRADADPAAGARVAPGHRAGDGGAGPAPGLADAGRAAAPADARAADARGVRAGAGQDAPAAALTAPTAAQVLAQQERAAGEPQAQQREQVRRESEAGAGQFELQRQEGRQDTTPPLFSRRPAQQDRDLVIAHSLTAENLLHAAKMGGIPVPSLAVTRKGESITNFGEITLIGDPAMADPRGGAQVFGADIYSPRYPRVERELDRRAVDALARKLAPMAKRMGLRLEVPHSELQTDGQRTLEREPVVMGTFLAERGIEPQVVPETGFTPEQRAALEASALAPYLSRTDAHGLTEDTGFAQAALAQYRATLEGRDALVSALDRDEGFQGNVVRDMARKVARDAQLRERPQADEYETRRALERQIEQAGLANEFQQYVIDQLEAVTKSERVFDGYTAAGRRRYLPHTLDNVVRLLKRDLRGGEGAIAGAGAIRARVTPRFRSVEQIRRSRDRLIPAEQFEAVRDEINTEFLEVARAFSPDMPSNTAAAILESAATRGVRAAAREMGHEISDAAAERASQFLAKLRNLPTAYFEAKIPRVVGLGEFRAAVVPEGVTPRALEALRAAGVDDIRTYPKGDTAARRAAVEVTARDAGAVFARRAAQRGMPTAEAGRIVEAIRALWANAPEVEVVASMQDAAVPEAVRQHDAQQRSAGAAGEPEGFFHRGKVYIVAGALNRPADVVRVLFHEALGHYGLRGVFGGRLDAILDQIAHVRAPEMRAKAKQYGLPITPQEARSEVASLRREAGKSELAGAALDQAARALLTTSRRQVAEEVLAEMAQTRPELGFVKRAIAAIRTWLREHVPGFEGLALSDAEIVRSFILPARNWVERGAGDAEAGPTHFSRAPQGAPQTPADDLAALDDLFALPRSDKTDLAGIVADLAPTATVTQRATVGGQTHFDIRFDDDTTARVTQRAPNPFEPSVYDFDLDDGEMINVTTDRPGDNPDDVDPGAEDVWIDVSLFQPGLGKGEIVYAAVANYAHNTGRIFIGDPAGLSDEAMHRRLEHMLSSALKFGTTRHLAPHPRQTRGAAGVPALRWVYGDDDGNIERMIDVSAAALKNAGIDLSRIAYDNGSFIDVATGRALQRGPDVLEVALQGELGGGGRQRPGGDARLRAGVPRAGQAGWRTAARTALLVHLKAAVGAGRQRRGRVLDGLRGQLPDLKRDQATGRDWAPQERIFYSRRKPDAVAPPDTRTAAERAQAIIETPAATSKPIDRAMRAVSRGAGLEATTSWVYDRIGDLLQRWTPERIKAGVVADYGVPEAVIDRRTLLDAAKRVQMRRVGVFLDRLGSLSRDESRVVYEWMNLPEGAERAAYNDRLRGLPEDSVRVLREVQQMIDDLSREAVRLGQLSPEAYQRHRFAYVRRSYLKHVVGADPEHQAMRRRAITVLGDQYRGRGLEIDAGMAQMRATAPEWWGRKLRAGRADAALKNERFIRLERRAPSGEGVAALPGVEGQKPPGRVVEVAYWPAGQPLPPRYGDWSQTGVFEVRDVRGDRVVLWRDWTKQEREQMGEIDEARFAIARTLQGMIHDVEIGRYFEWMARTQALKPGEEIKTGSLVDASERWRDTFKTDEWVRVPQTKVTGTDVLKYGALAGRIIPGPVWNDIRHVVNTEYAPFGEVYAKVLLAWKLSKTALSPAVHMNNVMSNFVMADWHDVSAGHIYKALRILLGASQRDGQGLIGGVGNVLARAGMPDREAARVILDRYQDAGGDVGTWVTNEIAQDQLAPLLDVLERELATKGNASGAAQVGVLAALQHALHLRWPQAWESAKLSRPVTAVVTEGKNMIDLYQREDDVFRLAAWLREKETGADDVAAGKVARRSFLDYRINAPWIQAMRATAWPFISYTYRATPMLLETMGKKPHKLIKLMMFAGGLSALGSMIAGESAEDEERTRALLPDQLAGGVWGIVPKMIRMPWNDEHGSPVFLDVRRWVPVSDVVDVAAPNTALPWFPPLVPGGPLVIFGEIVANRSMFTGRPITLETDTGAQKAAKVADHLYKALMPNLVILPNTHAWDGVVGSLRGRTDAFGREASTAQALARSVGVRLGSYPQDVLEQNLRARTRIAEVEIERNIRQLQRQLDTGRISHEQFERDLHVEQQKLERLRERMYERLQ